MLLCDHCFTSSLASLLKRLPRSCAFWTSDPLRRGRYTVSKRWTMKHPYIHTYIHIISFRRSINSVVQTVGHETCHKKTNRQKKQTQYKSNKTKQKQKKTMTRYRCQYYSLQIQRQMLCITC